MINIFDYYNYPIFVVIIDKHKSRKSCTYKWLYPLCIQYLQNSMHSFLDDQGFDYNGILVLDEINPKRSLTHSIEHLLYKFGNPLGKTYTKIIEAPFFVNSKCSAGIQFADVFATIIRRQENLSANMVSCGFTSSLFKRIRRKAYTTNKKIKGFNIKGYLKPFR
jgi:hypothetical protein